jgi:hypothetical protein
MATSKVRLPWFTASPKKIMHPTNLTTAQAISATVWYERESQEQKMGAFLFLYTL